MLSSILIMIWITFDKEKEHVLRHERFSDALFPRNGSNGYGYI